MAEPQVDQSTVPKVSPSFAFLPQLRLHHLFALTAVMAALLAINGPQRIIANSNTTPRQLVPTVWVIWVVVYQVFAAAAITALTYGIVAHRRGASFFRQPGHWLLLEISITTVLGIPISLLFRWFDFSPRIGAPDWNVTLMAIFSLYTLLALLLGRIVLNVYLARKCSHQRWKRVFYGKAFDALFIGVADIFIVVFALVALRADRREEVQRDASHWCGVLVQLSMSSLNILNVAFGVLNLAYFFGELNGV